MADALGRQRTRNFATIVYPESAPPGWIDTLRSFHVAAFVSPLHDQDTKDNGELKKPHFHVLLMFDTVKTEAQARHLFGQIGGVGCEIVFDLTGYARYLVHMDDTDKVRYSIGDIMQLSGANYYAVVERNVERYETIHDMQLYCRENHIYSYAQFSDFCYLNNMIWYRMICDSGAVVMEKYMKSLRWEETVDGKYKPKQ